MSYSFKRIWDNISNKVIVVCLWLSDTFASIIMDEIYFAMMRESIFYLDIF